MSEIIKCPDCQGSKCIEVSDGKYRCQYCGATFEKEKPKEEKAEAVVSQPVQTAPQVIYIQQQPQVQQQSQPNKVGNKNRGTAALLAFFLGAIGGQYFYLGKTGIGLLCLVFCWTWIPCVIALIDIIRFLSMSDQEFDMRYNMR